MFIVQLASRLAFSLAASAVCMADTLAQSYPTHAIRLIIPFAPGGGVDVVGRLTATKLSEGLGQTVVVDTRPGGGGVLGAAIAARAAPDGYTLVMGNNSTHGVSQVFDPKLPYDTMKDFTPITLVAVSQEVLLIGAVVPAKSTREFIALAKSKPGQFNYGSSGTGSHSHLVGELFKFVTGINMVHIPYKGTGQTYTALMSGETQLMFSGTAGAMPHIQSGRLRALGITGVKRSEYIPDLPTLNEQSVKGLETGLNYILLGPAGMPGPIVTRLNREIVKLVSTADFKQKLSAEALDPVGNTPKECAEGIRSEIAKWTKLAKDTGIRVD